MSFLNTIADFLSSPSPVKPPGPSNEGASNNDIQSLLKNGTYAITSQDWYTAKPYGFKLLRRNGSSFVMFLPISPTNLSISTSFATNIIPTLYGTIEEHSEVRYYDIAIEGTTGISPRFVEPQFSNGKTLDESTVYKSTRKSGRSSFPLAESFSAGGFFSKTLDALTQITNKVADIQGKPQPRVGVNSDNSGYAAFHNLYRLLLQYKRDTAGSNGGQIRSEHPLIFFNYKDGNQYNVAVRRFDLKRSADNPMLYHYTIHLRGYRLQTVTGSTPDENLKQRLTDLGLDGVSSSTAFGRMKDIASQAKGIVGTAIGGINILGR